MTIKRDNMIEYFEMSFNRQNKGRKPVNEMNNSKYTISPKTNRKISLKLERTSNI